MSERGHESGHESGHEKRRTLLVLRCGLCERSIGWQRSAAVTVRDKPLCRDCTWEVALAWLTRGHAQAEKRRVAAVVSSSDGSKGPVQFGKGKGKGGHHAKG
jgi:hypothetical protein